MNRESALQVEALDRSISDLQKTLRELSETLSNNRNGPRDFAQLHQKTLLEKEIQQKRTQLHVLLRGQPRPWYFHRLPPEMLVAIFQWITEPSDQLKLLQIFPRLGPLMHWDEGTLYFKQIYPLILPRLWKDWRDVWRVCQVSRDFMNVVLDHLRSVLSETINQYEMFPFGMLKEYIYGLNELTELVEECDRLGRTEWMTNMPFLATVRFYAELDTEEDDEEDEEYDEMDQMDDFWEFLDAHGSRLWSCNIVLHTLGYPENELQTILHETLRRMPYLVSLEFSHSSGDTNVPKLGAYPWPNLPCLRTLHTCENDSFDFSLIQGYGPQLQVLRMRKFPQIPELRFPLLLKYSANWCPNTFPHSFLNSPLKNLCLKGLNLPGQICEVLMTLNPFGNTLETLALGALRRSWEIAEPLDMDTQLMAGIWLPKLRYLYVGCSIRALDGLLALPSLHTLNITRDMEEVSPGLIYLVKSGRRHLSTNIWQKLPNLQKIYMDWTPIDLLEDTFYHRPEH